ncbi:MAG TPA: 5-oxoprolinase subunit PxpA, partial [Puia sp.]|nr:5-oxoprolinase subunit PxpA [Puia sp.]
MLSIDLNCDLGEGSGNDAEIMPFISSANIACGYHASDEKMMFETIGLAMQNNVAIGAHPSFKDKENFGRKEYILGMDEYYELIINQLEKIRKIAVQCSARLHHVKPHGALYNLSARQQPVAAIIAKAVYDFDNKIIVYGLSQSHSVSEAEKLGLKTANEIFADRTYQDDGSLTPR